MPFAPADGVTFGVKTINVTATVWFAVMFESVYDRPPVWTVVPSSDHTPIAYPAFGTALNARDEPYVTVFAVVGVSVPFAPTDGVTV